ncbi:MAG TPA: STAS domain-containing protein [Methanoregula sp.]|nr:STAS domain-containing protein [Methanoregula sp.]
MAMEVARVNAVTIVTIPRRLDTNNAPEIMAEFKTLLAAQPGNMVLDFAGTEYIASSGLRILLQVTRDKMKTGGKVALAGIKPPVLKIFEIAGFTSIFTICNSREDAIRIMV